MLDIETLPRDREKWHEFYAKLDAREIEEIKRLQKEAPPCAPNRGTQTAGFKSKAYILGFGGAAFGGKSALIALLAILEHKRSVIFRKDANDCSGIIDTIEQFYGTKLGRNNQDKVFHFADTGHLVHWGGLSKPKSEEGWQGIGHDGVFYDEVTQILRAKMKFTSQWCRPSDDDPDQRCRIVMTFNPPGGIDGMDPNGMWVLEFFGPWINENHVNPAEFGELRWFIPPENPAYPDEEVECENDDPITVEVQGNRGTEKYTLQPQSRSFIQSLPTDNPYCTPEYLTNLYAQPKHLREAFMGGSFKSGKYDQPNQLIPGAWVEEAQGRWDPSGRQALTDAIGLDCSQGGEAFSAHTARHGWWWDTVKRKPGKECLTGADVAMWVIAENRDLSTVCVDANGIGASSAEALENRRQAVITIKGQTKPDTLRKLLLVEPNLTFRNTRCLLMWILRKVLDPETGLAPALPKDTRLRRQLIAPVWWIEPSGLLVVEPKELVEAKIGYSPDDMDAVIYSLANCWKTEGFELLLPQKRRQNKIVQYSRREKAIITPAEYLRRDGNLGRFPLRSSSWMVK